VFLRKEQTGSKDHRISNFIVQETTPYETIIYVLNGAETTTKLYQIQHFQKKIETTASTKVKKKGTERSAHQK